MTNHLLSKDVVAKAAAGISTLLEQPADVHRWPLIDEMIPAHTALWLSKGKASGVENWNLEQELKELKLSKPLYREAADSVLLRLRAALDSTFSVPNFLSEEFREQKHIVNMYYSCSDDVTNIWIQLDRRDDETEMQIAKTQAKLYRLFPGIELNVLVVPRNVVHLERMVPKSARRIVG